MSALRVLGHQAYRQLRFGLNDKLDARWNRDPLVDAPSGTEEEFHALAAAAAKRTYPEIEALEAQTGFAVDREWLDNLALHTQIVRKKSALGYDHGRLLYSLLRAYIARENPRHVGIVETGTARGFSALCMAKALEDAATPGHIVTIDRLPHLTPIYWNCIDDLEGRKTRRELLAPWGTLMDRITFVQGDTLDQVGKIGMARVNFAYLDAQHLEADVLSEFAAIAQMQDTGDMVVFDDVTPAQFPGVVAAVDAIGARNEYAEERLIGGRGYAWVTKRSGAG